MTGRRPPQTRAARPRPSRRSSPRRGSPPGHDSFPVVGLGASAGGLDAFRGLLAVLPAGTGMAFILIQHLDPTHASMMVDLLAGHTPMKVPSSGPDAARARAYLSHSAGCLSLDPRRCPATLGTVGASRRAPAVRLLPTLVGGRTRPTRDLRDP